MKYEVVISIGVPKIIWVEGPFKGAAADITIAKQSGVRRLLRLQEEAALADKGYRNDVISFVVPLQGHKKELKGDDAAYNYLVYMARQSVERVLKRLKIFHILKSIWKYSLTFHHYVVIACCKLTNFSLVFDPLDNVEY